MGGAAERAVGPAGATAAGPVVATAETALVSRKRKALNNGLTVAEKRRRVEGEVEITLPLLLGQGAQWRLPEQEQAIKRIVTMQDGETLITVLPTGACKSILFMLPALMRTTGTSIVVVPFVALMGDLVARAR